MNFYDLPDDILNLIMYFRKFKTCGNKATKYIQSHWKGYKTRILIGRFHMLRYLKDFRQWNPSINIFIERSKL